MGALLLGADYYGTLAAARAFGAHGIEVIMADDDRSAIALYSRFVTERRTCPALTDTDHFLAWLRAQGRAAPRELVLYPTNDHLAWLLAAHRDELMPLFLTYQPEEATIFGLLDKLRLAGAASAVGLETPVTKVAESNAALEDVARSMTFPLLLKPRTQIFLSSGLKGVLVNSPSELAQKAAAFRRQVDYGRALTERHPEVTAPLVQEYLPAAETSVFSVSGFRSREGELVVRGAMKVLQRPRKLGIGLCFEGRALEPDLVQKLDALCARVGYFGTFEAEFIASGERRLLIDFNPRFYSQMAFDHARGLNHALLAWAGARGDSAGVASLMNTARAWRSRGDEAYCYRGLLELVMKLQRVSGRMSLAQVRHWRTWLGQHRAHLVDAIWSGEDPMPTLVDSAHWVEHMVRHPRSFVRQYVLNQ
ncbi:MAG: carbamoyl-phosphate synthase [Archangium sp.]|nr:carbamoyl-phosphate synthase [Archangium sp.]